MAAVLPEEARLATDRKVATRAVAVEPQAAQQEQWAAAPTVVTELRVVARLEPRVVVQRAAAQAALRPLPVLLAARLAVVVRAAHKVAVAEVAADR